MRKNPHKPRQMCDPFLNYGKIDEMKNNLSFEINQSEISRLINILIAYGVKRLKVEDDKIKFTKVEFKDKLEKAKVGNRTSLRTKEDVDTFIDSL